VLSDYWVFGLGPSSGILKKATFRILYLLSSSGGKTGGIYSAGSVRAS
jgi:hypothetical protein